LGEITRVRTGKLDANAQNPGGPYPFFTCGEEILQIDHFAFDTEAILLAGNGNFNVKWYNGKFNAYQRTYVIEPEGVYGKWLFYAVQAALRTITRGNRGSVIRFIRIGDIVDSTVRLPPLDEQRRIVAEIEKQFTRLESGVAALRRGQANLKRYRAAVLKAACEGRLVPTEAELAKAENRKFETGEGPLARILTQRRQTREGRRKYKEPFAPDITMLQALPEAWTWATVDRLADETMIGLDRGRAQQSDDPATGVPYIKMNNVTMDGRVNCNELVYVPASRDEALRFAVQDGDILFNTRNSKELVGKVGLVRNPPVGAIYNNNLMRIRVPAGVSQAFLALQMCSHDFRQRMELVKKATTSVAAVYSKDLLPLAIAFPPLAEQIRIVAEVERRLSVVEELEAVVSANLRRATRLRQAILKSAFRNRDSA
jgi:type I restriction enzyme S subunit